MGGKGDREEYSPLDAFPQIQKDPWYVRIFPDWMVENPWEAFIGLLGSVSSLFLILGQKPASIERLLPDWLQFTWAIMLFIGCMLMLIGLGTRRILIERLGLQIFGPATIVYGTAILFVGGVAGLGAFFPYCLFSIVSYLQAYKLRRAFLNGAKFVERASHEATRDAQDRINREEGKEAEQ